MHRRLSVAAPALVLVVALTACGGGGHTATPAPAPTPTPTPSPTQTPCVSSVSRSSAGEVRRAAVAAHDGIVPNRLVVSYRSSIRSTDVIDRSVGAVQAAQIGTYRTGLSQRAITLPDGTDLAKAAAALRQVAGVTDVQPAHYRSIASIANDPYDDTTDQWYLYRTSVELNPATGTGAWQIIQGNRAVKVAIVDTGIDMNNTDLKSQLVRSMTFNAGNGQVVSSTTAQDTNGHGTNVAGLATAAANNGYGFAGVGYNVSLMAYKIFPDTTACTDGQSAQTPDEAAAINDAVANGASVINLSLGSPQNQGADSTEETAIENAIAAGVVVVAAGGNEYPSTGSNVPDYPGGYPGVIAVGASAVQDTVPNTYSSITSEAPASYSNSGPTLLAPGGDVGSNTNDSDTLHWIEGYSTTTANYPPDQCSNSGGVCRALFNGTSQATPQVSGTVALMMAKHGGSRSMSPALVLSTLTTYGVDQLPGVSSARQGAGRLDAYGAVTHS